jgi:DNA-binding transcriptional regulator GbsR (MarR family)
VHGRIWCLVFLSKEPIDANFIKDNLGISKALTSMSLNDLVHYRVIEEVKKTSPGTQKYAANPNITQVIIDVLKEREQVMLEKIKANFSNLDEQISKAGNEFIDPQRMESLGEMIHSAHSFLNSLINLASVDFKNFENVMTISED